jgi:hypothetical protein
MTPRAVLAVVVGLVALSAGCGGGGGDAASEPRPDRRDSKPAGVQRYIAAHGTADGDCTRDLPCRSLTAALAAADPGDVVEIAAGRYRAELLEGRLSRRRAPVVFRPAAGAEVELGGLRIAARGVVLERMKVSGLHVEADARDVVLRDLEISGALFITSASHISIIGGSVGPGTDVSPQIKAESGSTTPPRDILIEGVAFHDFTRTDPEAHVDCLHVMAAERLVLRGNSFQNCEAFDVLFTKFGEAGSPSDILIENNTLSCCRSGFYSLYFGGGHGERWRDILVRNNSADRAFSISTEAVGAGADIRFLSNVAPHVNPLLCGLPGVEWDYNVWAEGKPCGEHDLVAPSGFRDAGAGDFGLRPTAAAIDRGDPESMPETDAAGRRRPLGDGPDAGALEH